MPRRRSPASFRRGPATGFATWPPRSNRFVRNSALNAYQQLVGGLAFCVGIESVVVTRDICGLNHTEAEELKQWTANALLHQAIRDAQEESRGS